MPNIFKNREQKRKFNKLPDEKKKDLMTATIAKEVSGVLNKHIALSFIHGVNFEKKSIYEKYVKEIDELPVDSEDRNNKINEMLSHIRLEYLRIIQQEQEKEKEKDNQEEKEGN